MITYAAYTQNQVLTANCFCNPCTATKGGWLNHYCSSRRNFTTTQVSVRFNPNSTVRITVLSFLSFFRLSWSQYNSTIICIFWSLERFASIISSFHCSAARFHSVSFSKPNPVWFGKVTPKNCLRFSKPIPVWFGNKKIDFARRRFQTKFRLVWKILMTIVNVLKIPNQYQFGLEK